MRSWVAQTSDVPALTDYASTAQAYDYREAAANAYQRILVLDPNNSKALSQSAALQFSKGKYTEASKDLNAYLAQPKTAADAADTAQAHFYKAELLRRQGDQAGAAAEYNEVVRLSTQSPSNATDALSRLYTAQFRLGQHDAAKSGFESLLASHPDDKSILGDYMSILIEYHYLNDASRVANQYDKSSPNYGKGVSLQEPVAGANHVSLGANSGYVVRIILTAQEGFDINAGADDTPVQTTPVYTAPRPAARPYTTPIAFPAQPQIHMQPIAQAQPAPVTQAVAPAMPRVAPSTQVATTQPIYVAEPTPVAEVAPAAGIATTTPVAAAPLYSPQVEAQRQQTLRLQLLYARMEMDSGQTDKAKQRLAALDRYFPNDPQLKSYEASLASASGNKPEAMRLLRQAQTVSPENEDLALQMSSIERASQVSANGSNANYAKIDQAYRGLGKNNEYITSLSGAVHPTNPFELGFNVQNDFADTHQIRRESDGAIGDYNLTRQRGEIYGAYTLEGGPRLQASLFGNNDTAGMGGYFGFQSFLGHLEFLGEYHRPYWDFVEAVAYDANRDRVGVKDYANLTPTLSLGVETSLNTYNIKDADDVRNTALVRVSLVQQLQAQTKTQPYWGVGYGFDGEYKTGGDQKTGVDALGVTYPLFPLTDREIHSLTGIYQDDWTAIDHARFVAGVAYNRFGSSFSPLVDGRWDHDITDRWQFGLRGRYSLQANSENGSGSLSDNHELDLGADLLYKF